MHPTIRGIVVVALLYVFLLGVNGMSTGFESLGGDLLDVFFAATTNPFIALMVGILATSLMQSSSVTTSMVVALVAAPENPLPIANAVPMIMGANIGTTVTNSVVSLAHIGRKAEFERAFAIATCHDFFNFIAVGILLPLELMTGYLRNAATSLTTVLTGFGGVTYESPISGALEAMLGPIQAGLGLIVETEQVRGFLLILLSGAMIFGALFLLVKVLRSALQTKVESVVSRALGTTAVVSMFVGVIVTAMVQSSSITTSLLVPLGGAGLISLQQAFPVTIGANIGTTVTALLAALAATGVNASAGITIAIVHLLFNLNGTLLIYPIERVRAVPLSAARWLAKTATKSRQWALVYVVALFYGVPALFAFLNNLLI